MSKKVFIGVGHGGVDSGAVGNGFREKELALSISLYAYDVLKRHGLDVLLSRTKDVTEDLNQRIKECNECKPDVALDLHINAGGGDGAEAFYHYKGGLSKTLADNILSEIVSIGQNSRGAKIRKGSDGRDYYGFIRETVAPATIIECAFIDNAKDIQIIDTPAEQKAMGVAVAKGVLKTLGIKYQNPTNQSKGKAKYKVQVGAFENKTYAENLRKELISKGYEAIIVEVK